MENGNEQKTAIRCSSLQSYNDCARRTAMSILKQELAAEGYEFRTRTTGAGSAIGTACHRGSYYYLTALKDGVTADIETAIDAAIDKYEEKTSQGVDFDDRTNSHNAARKQIRTILTNLLSEINPDAGKNILDLERRIIAGIDEDFQLSGQPDIAMVSSVDDTKFGGVLRPAQCQFGGYSLLRKSVGHVVKKTRMIYAPRVSVGSAYPGVQVVTYDPAVCERAAWWTIKSIVRDVRRYRELQAPTVFQCNPMSQMCSSRYCEAHGTDWCEITKGS